MDPNPSRLSDLAGRSPERSDSRETHAKLINAVSRWVTAHGAAPTRLADIAELAGVSTATAYRHFASIDDVIQAFVLEMPVRAVDLFEQAGGSTGDPLAAFQRWNLAWVKSCLEHGPLAVHLRSSQGFLERRAAEDPVIGYACSHIEPLIEALTGDPLLMLFMWNVTSDPREVLDLKALGWDADEIASFVTNAVLVTPPSPHT